MAHSNISSNHKPQNNEYKNGSRQRHSQVARSNSYTGSWLPVTSTGCWVKRGARVLADLGMDWWGQYQRWNRVWTFDPWPDPTRPDPDAFNPV